MGGLKATVGNRVLPDYHFINKDFCFFCFFQPESFFISRLCSEAYQHILNIAGLSEAEI